MWSPVPHLSDHRLPESSRHPPTAPRSVPQCQCPFKRSVCQCPAATSTRRSPTSRHPPSVCRRVATRRYAGSGATLRPLGAQRNQTTPGGAKEKKQELLREIPNSRYYLSINYFIHIYKYIMDMCVSASSRSHSDVSTNWTFCHPEWSLSRNVVTS